MSIRITKTNDEVTIKLDRSANTRLDALKDADKILRREIFREEAKLPKKRDEEDD